MLVKKEKNKMKNNLCKLCKIKETKDNNTICDDCVIEIQLSFSYFIAGKEVTPHEYERRKNG